VSGDFLSLREGYAVRGDERITVSDSSATPGRGGGFFLLRRPKTVDFFPVFAMIVREKNT
jgi:hypothetical protein